MLDVIEREAGEDIGASVIWLHGLGASGHDFEDIVPQLGLPASLGVRFVFPHGPLRPVAINDGYVMRAWYDVLGFDPETPQDESGIRDSESEISALIEREKSRGVAPNRIVLAGFSQGGVMALHTGLRHGERLAGVLALSCYLALDDRIEAERDSANATTPVFMAHGRYDDVVPVALGYASYQRLAVLGQPVEWQEYPMGHEVISEEVTAIGRWLDFLLT